MLNPILFLILLRDFDLCFEFSAKTLAPRISAFNPILYFLLIKDFDLCFATLNLCLIPPNKIYKFNLNFTLKNFQTISIFRSENSFN
jgi:hypothetical protein